ncbi:MAG: polysaccharide deacetylase family protein [Kiritimatiellae bacterium]|nr:polysaccharide deacetylase family protein [Kiritimatiellia bacterium]MDD4734529.1 polysaccharide deacetylase family protein [Kiritimatiellia bacterium]
MKSDVMTVVQCWDDGVTTDIRLVEILRRHGAKATFNLNAGLHGRQRMPGWEYRGTPVGRLAWDELPEVYEGFTIANHSLTHPRLETLSADDLRREIVEGRERLQDCFGQPVLGFVYPFGTCNETVMDAVREAGHIYARTAKNEGRSFPPADAMRFDPNSHFLAEDFQARYEQARADGVFYFWGHSYELIQEADWKVFEETIARISSDRQARWGVVADLFG